MLPLIKPCALTVPVLVRPPAVVLSVPVVVSVPEFIKPVATVFQMPELTTTLALLASPFHVPKLLTVAPPVLLSRFPVQVPEFVMTAAGPVLLAVATKMPLFVTVPELSKVSFKVPLLTMLLPTSLATFAANTVPLTITPPPVVRGDTELPSEPSIVRPLAAIVAVPLLVLVGVIVPLPRPPELRPAAAGPVATLAHASPPAISVIRCCQKTLLLEIVRAASPAQSTMLITPPAPHPTVRGSYPALRASST